MNNVTLSKAVRNGRPSLRVYWTAPQSDVPISQYNVQYRRSGTTSWGSQVTVSHPATSAFLIGLDAGTKYNVRVRARSAAGSGVWSAVQTERTHFGGEFLCIICCYRMQ